MNYIITGNTYNSKFISDIARRDDVTVLSGEELEHSEIYFAPQDKVYIPSETSLSIAMQRMRDQSFVEGIEKLKNKYLCRKALSSIYPDFYFAKVSREEIVELELGGKKVAIKPIKGFFGTGVRIADGNTNLRELAQEMNAEVAANARFFPASILDNEEYIVEEYIEGEEFAVDMFYDNEGKPAIMNIYYHPLPAIEEYFHLMYYTNMEIFSHYLPCFTDFFEKLNGVLNLSCFPIHAEFKLQGGVMVPIELNPMRYGGFGLADLTFNSFGFQPISAYFDDQPVDWQEIWQTRKEQNYGWVLGYNGKDIDIREHLPNHDKFLATLSANSQLLDYVRLDHTSNPVFGLAYLKNSNLPKMLELLSLELNDYFL
jgi:hypothetical protein